MKRIYWSLVFLLVSVTSIYSQQVLSDRHLEWKAPRTYHVRIDRDHTFSGNSYYFEGARYFNPQTRLPWYYELIPVGEASGYRVNLTNTTYKKLTGNVSLYD